MENKRVNAFFRTSFLLFLVAILSIGSCAVRHKKLLPRPTSSKDEVASLKRHFLFDDGHPAFKLSYYMAENPQKPRIVFVHGTPGSARAFVDYVVHPGFDREIISYDRPGFGESQPDHAVPPLTRQALALKAFLVKQGGQWPILVGHSLGGPIICQAAAEFPDQVGGLVILAGSLDPALEHIAWYQRLAQWWILPRILPHALVVANREVIPLKKELEGLEKILPRITCPVVIVQGTKDRLVPPANVPFMVKHMTGVAEMKTVIIPGQNHFLPWNNRQAVHQAIAGLIALTAREKE